MALPGRIAVDTVRRPHSRRLASVTPLDTNGIGDLLAFGRRFENDLDAFERAAAANPAPPRGRRHRVEHIETIDLADVPRFGALGVIASMQPPHTRLMNSPNPRG